MFFGPLGPSGITGSPTQRPASVMCSSTIRATTRRSTTGALRGSTTAPLLRLSNSVGWNTDCIGFFVFEKDDTVDTVVMIFGGYFYVHM